MRLSPKFQGPDEQVFKISMQQALKALENRWRRRQHYQQQARPQDQPEPRQDQPAQIGHREDPILEEFLEDQEDPTFEDLQQLEELEVEEDLVFPDSPDMFADV